MWKNLYINLHDHLQFYILAFYLVCLTDWGPVLAWTPRMVSVSSLKNSSYPSTQHQEFFSMRSVFADFWNILRKSKPKIYKLNFWEMHWCWSVPTTTIYGSDMPVTKAQANTFLLLLHREKFSTLVENINVSIAKAQAITIYFCKGGISPFYC